MVVMAVPLVSQRLPVTTTTEMFLVYDDYTTSRLLVDFFYAKKILHIASSKDLIDQIFASLLLFGVLIAHDNAPNVISSEACSYCKSQLYLSHCWL